jgi:hypothetical protein
VPAPSSGFTSQTFNGGEIRNRDRDRARLHAGHPSDVNHWTTRGTFTRYTSEVVDLAGLPAFFPAASGFGNLGRTYASRRASRSPRSSASTLNDGRHAGSHELSQLGNSAPDFRVGFVNDVRYGR